MADLVRVRLENGAETNVSAALAEVAGVDVLDEPTHNPDGSPRATTRNGRRRKPKTTVAKSAAAKRAVTESADNEKE